ncbi:GNAT family N-acetyltransferase (plasmid) [Paraburkholderia sprentiae WSM5005]|uniref:GNAT family N-acetyltransferase n=1 Tax=Paraburkholderia sprentiae WSM5005 TaxID=754502 RepID=A0A1I9YTG7_9BURK|nr:GNAT family N-acetyltransferase [Paraburkholderia sprentiae]APA89507.1 GNAT family N-acetyltransferase [Paraburkholderia sprentiae WSM5005]
MSEFTVKKSPRYRRFTSDDIAAAHALSVAVRWPHRAEDWRFMYDAGTGFVAEDNGSVIGTALCWKFGADRGTLGLVIVSPNEQGRGIGRKLMELVLEELGNRVTFLHATVAGKPLYEKLGFVACGGLTQHQGTLGSVAAVAPPAGEHLRAATPADLPCLIELASRASGLDRSATIPSLLEFAQGVVLERDGEVLGFSLCRPFGRGYSIGPVVAQRSPDDLRARALISYWLAQHAGDFARIDVPGDAGIDDWLTSVGLTRVDSVEKMVRNAGADAREAAPDATWRAYGIINQAMA